MSDRDIRALLRLLSDDDPAIAEQAGDALVDYGEAALPALHELADRDPSLASRLTQRIEARLLEEEWAQLAQNPDAETAAILVARWLDPLLDPDQIVAQLDALAEPLRDQLPMGNTSSDYRTAAHAFRDWLARAKGFRGNIDNYYAPANSLIPAVLETKRGIPLTLSMVYLFVARRLDAPIYPIGMPYHFIVRYGDEADGVFLDPFHQGTIMTRRDCQRFLMQHGVVWSPEHLRPITDHSLIERMLRNLVNAYAMQGDEAAVAQVVKYLDIWTDHRRGE